jgi:hypothetical protein
MKSAKWKMQNEREKQLAHFEFCTLQFAFCPVDAGKFSPLSFVQHLLRGDGQFLNAQARDSENRIGNGSISLIHSARAWDIEVSR